jgi:hypothetical protein
MTILNTGSNKKFASGWEKIFSGKETKQKADVSAQPKAKKSTSKAKPAVKKKPAPAKKKSKK